MVEAQDDAGLRDALAVERTRLANERTLLAYVRTALAVLAGGIVLPQLWPQYRALAWLAWAIAAAALAVLLIGVWRFLHLRRQLRLPRLPGRAPDE